MTGDYPSRVNVVKSPRRLDCSPVFERRECYNDWPSPLSHTSGEPVFRLLASVGEREFKSDKVRLHGLLRFIFYAFIFSYLPDTTSSSVKTNDCSYLYYLVRL
ncbi:hypothetical protein CEXT_417721 [Caerostris extrusa]|uniref:Uncharacterized protein n=1 Tax=Caerostris extrusa TaxID=172846 RepID=A0AAV4PY18_CAEEX|nr:hypothetical protein CEXT_417721 [Caerostris extrusa]